MVVLRFCSAALVTLLPFSGFCAPATTPKLIDFSPQLARRTRASGPDATLRIALERAGKVPDL